MGLVQTCLINKWQKVHSVRVGTTSSHDCQKRKIVDRTERTAISCSNKNQPRNTIGTQSSQVSNLDEKYLSNESDIRQKAENTRREREKRGEGIMHSQLQPFSRPNLNDLIDKRIDVLYDVDLEDSKKGLRWCQGTVVSVIDDKNVQVDWDPAPLRYYVRLSLRNHLKSPNQKQ